jgi:hypothetical protein
MLNDNTSHGMWAAYFIVCGVGAGCAISLPYTAVSAVLKEEDMVTGNGKCCLRPTYLYPPHSLLALLQFAFQLGGAVSLCIFSKYVLQMYMDGEPDERY